MKRALVLSGGGPVGVAWESGLIAGFAEGGVDLGDTDFILGTSAGAIVGARLASGVATARVADVFLGPQPEAPAGVEAVPAQPDFGRLRELMAEAQTGVGHPAQARRELGTLALGAETMDEATALGQFSHVLGDIPMTGWPGRPFACTAVDVEDGGFQLWEARSGVDLLPAVASSCAVPGLYPPVSLAGRRYMDGGMRSATNADLAVGHEIVVVLSVQPPGSPPWTAQRLAEEVDSLQAGDATVVTITPDDGSGAEFAGAFLDFDRDARVARAGFAQGLAQAEILKQIWG